MCGMTWPGVIHLASDPKHIHIVLTGEVTIITHLQISDIEQLTAIEWLIIILLDHYDMSMRKELAIVREEDFEVFGTVSVWNDNGEFFHNINLKSLLMANLISRVIIRHVRGGGIATVYTRNIVESFFPNVDPASNTSLLTIGNVFVFNREEFVIRNIEIYLFSERQEIVPGYGVGLENVGEIGDFDMSIVLIVERVN